MALTIETAQIVLTVDDTEIPCIVTFNYQPALTGRTEGPPESCEEPQPELIEPIELWDVTEDTRLTPMLYQYPEIRERVIEKILMTRTDP